MQRVLPRGLATLFVAAAHLCSLTPVAAQVPPVRFESPRLALLWEEAVLKELRLSAEQRQQIKLALDELFEDAPDGHKRVKMPATGFHPSPEDFNKLDQRLEKQLTADQAKRWNELHLQRLGYRALALSQVAQELNLTSAQRTKVDNAMDNFQSSLREKLKAQKGKNGPARLTPELLAELDREFTQELGPRFLAPEQQQRWGRLQGMKFTFPQRSSSKPAPK